jgi:hypothetical protein
MDLYHLRKPRPTDPTSVVSEILRGAIMKGVGPLRVAMREVTALQMHHLRIEQPSLMHDCCREGDAACVLLLKLEFGFSFSQPFGDEGYPFHMAAAAGNVNVLQLLVTYPTEETHSNEPTALSKKLPIHLAAAAGHMDCMKVLLLAGMGGDVHSKDGKGRTPLHLAADGHHFGTVRCLTSEFGADITAVSGDMRAVWMGAVEASNFPLVKILCDPKVLLASAGVETKRKAFDGARPGSALGTALLMYNTPLQFAVISKHLDDEHTLQMVRFLVGEVGHDPNVLTTTKMHLAHLAEKRNKQRTAEYLTSIMDPSVLRLALPPFL